MKQTLFLPHLSITHRRLNPLRLLILQRVAHRQRRLVTMTTPGKQVMLVVGFVSVCVCMTSSRFIGDSLSDSREHSVFLQPPSTRSLWPTTQKGTGGSLILNCYIITSYSFCTETF